MKLSSDNIGVRSIPNAVTAAETLPMLPEGWKSTRRGRPHDGNRSIC
jgi:hypothetical protein